MILPCEVQVKRVKEAEFRADTQAYLAKAQGAVAEIKNGCMDI